MDVTINLTVNGKKHTVTTPSDRPLLEVIREDLGLTGTKYGCGEGQCRACTVLLDGRPAASCLTPASKADGKNITTIEGLANGGGLHPVQEAYLEEQASQCGYCVPGMILTAASLLENNPNPTEEEIEQWMQGNICRCGTYPRIVKAIQRAASMATK